MHVCAYLIVGNLNNKEHSYIGISEYNHKMNSYTYVQRLKIYMLFHNLYYFSYTDSRTNLMFL